MLVVPVVDGPEPEFLREQLVGECALRVAGRPAASLPTGYRQSEFDLAPMGADDVELELSEHIAWLNRVFVEQLGPFLVLPSVGGDLPFFPRKLEAVAEGS